MNDLHIERCFKRPANHLVISGVERYCAKWCQDFDGNRRQTKLLVKHIYVLLQGGTAIRDDIDDCLPFTCKSLLCQCLKTIVVEQGMRGLTDQCLPQYTRSRIS